MSYVYKLCLGSEIVYIGKTGTPDKRLKQHKRDKKFDRMYICEVPNATEVEKELIGYHKPKYNSQHRVASGNVCDIDWWLFYVDDSSMHYNYPKGLVSYSGLTGAEKMLWVVMHHRYDQCMKASSKYEDMLSTLKNETGLSKTKVQEALQKLISCGFVEGEKVKLEGGGAVVRWKFYNVVNPLAVCKEY